MAIEELLPSVDETREQAVAIAANVAPQWAHGDYNFLGKLARKSAQLFSGFFRTLRQLDADALPSKDSSDPGLDKHADTYGLPSGAGTNKYGRHVPIAATGLQGTIKGTSGATAAAGDLLLGPDGATIFRLRTAVTIPGIAPGTGQIGGIFDAVTPGVAGNLSAGASLTWSPGLAGIDAAVVVTVGSKTGRDTEDSGSLYERLRIRLQLPPKGGAPQDYAHGAEAWAENALDASGNPITNIRAYGYSGGYDGTGGVMVVATVNGSGLARIPTADQLAAIDNYIRGTTTFAGKSPISHSYRTIAPFMDPLVTGLVIVNRVVPSSPALAFDWRRGTTTQTVFQWDGASKLTFNGLAPADLKLAIDNAQKPRLYVDTRIAGAPVGPVIPPMARCLAWNDTDVPGKTTVTLETPLPPTWQAPSVGDEIYSGQAAICDAEAGVPASINLYIDNLGTSRVSGCQDPGDIWDDTASVGGVVTAAQNTVAGDGVTPLLARSVANETKIGVGIAAPAEQDVQAPDNSTFGPGLWFATRILVTDI